MFYFAEFYLIWNSKELLHLKKLLPSLAKLNLPILFCFGDEDILVNETMIEQLTATNLDINYQKFVNCGHMLPLEQPVLLAKAIADFININSR